jgi:hypothetical protein
VGHGRPLDGDGRALSEFLEQLLVELERAARPDFIGQALSALFERDSKGLDPLGKVDHVLAELGVDDGRYVLGFLQVENRSRIVHGVATHRSRRCRR